MWDILEIVIYRSKKTGRIWTQEATHQHPKPWKCSFTPLQLAAKKGNIRAIELLLSLGSNVNFPADERSGKTALQAACSRKSPNMEAIIKIVEAGGEVNANATSFGGLTAMQAAAITGFIPVLEYLFDHGADVNGKPALEEGRTAIEGAAEWGRLDMVQWLLNHGAIGDVSGNEGFRSAIKLASDNGHVEIVEILQYAQLELDMHIYSGDLIDEMATEL